ncbi:MAG TPA: hypothetical protein VKE98_11425 [Gemmataceae bacterium]|nr:hypothetical protein [Gemmataceae bacterium]
MTVTLLTPRRKSKRKRQRKLQSLVVGCILSLCCVLVAALVLMNSAGETARANYEKLRAGLTLQDAQAVLAMEGSDTPPAEMSRRFLFACSEVYRSDRRGTTKAHYWVLRDGLIIGRFDSDAIIVAKTYMRAGGEHAE